MLKVVLDTNQFVSAIITKKGVSAQLLEAWRKHAYILITSEEIIKEVKKVLRYPHIAKKYHLQEEAIESFVQLIEHEAVVSPGFLKVEIIKDDPDDNKILACALEAKAQYLISGDDHLLKLHQYGGIIILTAQEFLKNIDSKRQA